MNDISKMLRAEALTADEDWTGIYQISPNLAFAAADRIEKLEAALRQRRTQEDVGAAQRKEDGPMTDNLVRQLRCYADIDDAVYNPWVYGEAANRIERLEDELHHCFHRINDLQTALRGVISVADRDCPEFRFARKALDAE